MKKAVRDIKHYRKKPTHKYRVVDYSSKTPNIDKFCYTLEEAEDFVFRNCDKIVGAVKKKLEIEETDYFKQWKKANEIQ